MRSLDTLGPDTLARGTAHKDLLLQRLRQSIGELQGQYRSGQSVLTTGWPDIDRQLSTPQTSPGGLAYGALHEWLPTDQGAPPPLEILLWLAARAVGRAVAVVWVGRSVWPSGYAVRRAGMGGRSVFVDAPALGDRVWAMDVALRCPGVVVVADGSGLPLPASRRLQLAAESGGTLGLIARPAPDAGVLSVAMTRWRVRPVVAPRPCWELTLARRKASGGMGIEGGIEVGGTQEPTCMGGGMGVGVGVGWVLERTEDGRLVVVSPGVVGGSGASRAAS